MSLWQESQPFVGCQCLENEVLAVWSDIRARDAPRGRMNLLRDSISCRSLDKDILITRGQVRISEPVRLREVDRVVWETICGQSLEMESWPFLAAWAGIQARTAPRGWRRFGIALQHGHYDSCYLLIEYVEVKKSLACTESAADYLGTFDDTPISEDFNLLVT